MSTRVFHVFWGLSRACHEMVILSLIAPGAAPQRPSSQRSSSTRAMASARLSRASSLVAPWPFASGISGQKAMYHSSSRSIIAVNSFFIAVGPVVPGRSKRNVTRTNMPRSFCSSSGSVPLNSRIVSNFANQANQPVVRLACSFRRPCRSEKGHRVRFELRLIAFSL